MADDSSNYAASQRKHADKIRTERALMDAFGISRSQARRLNDGLTEFHQRIEAQKAEPEFLGPPAPPQFQVTETKNEVQGNVGGLGRNPAGGGVGAGGQAPLNLEVQAIVVNGTTLTAETVLIYGEIV